MNKLKHSDYFVQLAPQAKPPVAGLRAVTGYRLLSIGSALCLLLLWQLCTWLQIFPAQILVSPQLVAQSFVELWAHGELQQHLRISMSRLLLGFAIGSLTGLSFGLLYASSAAFKNYVAVLFYIGYQIPIFVLIPIFILVFGIGELFKILLIIKACFFPIALATIDAVKNIDKAYIELGKLYRLKARSWLSYILLPSVLPPLISALRIALGRAWLILVAVELLAAGSGIGQMMELARQMLRLDIVMVGIILTGGIGFLFDQSLRWIERRWCKNYQLTKQH
jgi:sulfonate transport system permease protein